MRVSGIAALQPEAITREKAQTHVHYDMFEAKRLDDRIV